MTDEKNLNDIRIDLANLRRCIAEIQQAGVEEMGLTEFLEFLKEAIKKQRD